MFTVVGFWERKREWLADDYSDENGTVHCALLAEEIAALLKDEGKSPLLVDLRGKIIDQTGNRKSLVPLAYGDSVSWGGHCVCIAKGIVYDPMLQEPTPLTEYAIRAFGEPIDAVRAELV